METKHINEIFEEKVNQIFLAAREEGLREFTANIGDKLPTLDLIDQFKLLFAEFKRIDELEQVSEYPFYIHNHANQQNLLNQFSSRAFLLNVDESTILFDCIKLGRIKSEIEAKIDLTARLIPKYTFDDFLSGVPNPFLFELGISKFFNEMELYKIMKWQEESLIEIIDQETSKLIKLIQTKCKSIKDPETFLKNELIVLKFAKENHFKSGEEIKKWLSNLFIIKDQKIDSWDSEALIYSYSNYTACRCGHRYLIPSNQTKRKGKHYSVKQLLLPSEVTIFCIIHKYTEWLNAVVKKKCWDEKYEIFNWRTTLANTFIETEKRIGKKVDEIENELMKHPENKREQFLFEQFHRFRKSFNSFQNKRYFEFWTGIAPDEYFRKFTAYGYFENGPLQQIKMIGDALFVQRMAWIVNRKFMEVAQDHIDEYIDMEEFTNEIPVILSHMVFTKEFYKNTLLYGNPFLDEYWYYGLPVEMMQFNYRDYLEDYLQSVLNELETILKKADQNKGILYLQSRLKQMRLRSLDYRKYRLSDQRHKVKSKYSDIFKDYLEIEAQFIKETENIPSPNLFPEKRKVKESFESIFGSKDGQFVLTMLDELGITKEGQKSNEGINPGAIWGIAIAIKENVIESSIGIRKLSNSIGSKIGVEIKSNLNPNSFICKEYRKQATKYIQEHYSL